MRKLLLPLLIISLVSCALYFTRSSSAAVTTTIAAAGTPLDPLKDLYFNPPMKAAGCTRGVGLAAKAFRLNMTTAGSYTFTINPTGFVGRVYVYKNSFDPLEPCQNIVNQTDSGGVYVNASPLTLTLNASSVNNKWVVVFHARDLNSGGTFSASVTGPGAVSVESDVTTQIAPAGTPLNDQNYKWQYPLTSDCNTKSGVVPFAAYSVAIPVKGIYTFKMNTNGFNGRVFVFTNFDPTQPCYSIQNAQDTEGHIITSDSITLAIPVFFDASQRTIVFTADEPVTGTFSASMTGPSAVTPVESELKIDSQSSSKSVSSGCVQTISVYATGPGPQHFQWYEGVSGDLTNSVIIPGANTNAYTTPALVGDKSYWVRVSYGDDHVDSATIRFKVYQDVNTPFKGILDPLQTWNLKTTNCNTSGPTVHYRAFHMRIPVGGQYRIHLNNTSFGQYAITTYSNSFDATQPCVNFNGGVTNTDNVGFLPGGQDTIIVISSTNPNTNGSFEGYISSIDSCTLPETIEDALIISGNPLDQAVTPGNAATMQFAFSGGSAGAKGIQWYKGVSGDTSQPINGANATTYTTPGLTQANNETTYYYYWARVNDPDSFTYADTATAVISVINPPITYSDVLSQCDEVYPQVNGPTTYYKIFPFKVSTPGTYTFNVTANGFTPKTALYHGIFFPQFPNVNYSGDSTTQNLIASTNNYYLVITTTGASQTGSFTVNVSGPALVVPSLRPQIKTHPSDQTILRGQSATLSVTTNSPALTYQWYSGSCANKTAVGGTQSTYTTPPLTDYKDYWVKVSYGVMYVNSNIAHVSIKPEAINDSYTTDEDVRLDVAAPGVLSNDKGADSRILRAEDLVVGSLGSAHLDNTGFLTYGPNANINGTETLKYRVKDGTLLSDYGNITITIREINDPPVKTGGSVTDHTFTEDGNANILHLGGLAYGPGGGADEAGQVLTYKVTAVPPSTLGNVQLSDGTNVTANTTYTISQIQGMKFKPAANGYGVAPFTFSVTDNGTSRGSADPKTLTQSMNITVKPVADLPAASSAATDEDTTSPAIVLDRNAADGTEVTHFRVDQFQNGTLYKNDGVTQLTAGSVITYAEGHAGLKFKPAANLFSPSSGFRFNVAALIGDSYDQFSSSDLTVTITVNPVAELPSVTSASTFVNQQSNGGLVITRNNLDGTEIGFFKISSIANGTLFKNDGITAIANGQFVTAAEASAGLKFTPANNSTSTGSFLVQGAASATGDGLGPAATASISVSKSNTTTAVVSVNPEPSYLNQSVAVNFTVTNTSSAATPAGNVVVTISGGTETCTAPVSAGTCSMTLNASGNPRVVTATYQGNEAFFGSSGTLNHVVENCTPNTVVTTTADDGTPGTLRSIVANACAGSTITFDPAVFDPAHGPYTIDLGTYGNIADNLLIDKQLNIVGPGAPVLTVRRALASRTRHFRIFNIGPSGVATISGLTISGGFANGGPNEVDGHGGGILNAGSLTLRNVAIINSQAGREGLASSSGGGIYSTGTLLLINSTVSGNKAFITNGGGLYLASGGVSTIVNSTISGNSAAVSGGGLSVHGHLSSFNSTSTNNSAAISGGGIYLESGQVSSLANSIVAGNSAPVAPDVQAVSGVITSSGHNLIGKNDGAEAAFIAGSPNSNADLVGTSASPALAMLAPLANNGGPTQTHLLLPNSPALNAGSNTLLPVDIWDADNDGDTSELLSIDQRGVARVQESMVDIGAVEVGYAISASAGDGQSATINTTFGTQLQLTVTEAGSPKSGVPVTFTAPESGASGSFASSATVTTDANGVATAPVFTANGVSGSYVVTANVNDSLTASYNLTNTQAEVQITLGNLSQTYDGSAKGVSVATTPSGIAVNVTYHGSATLPVNAGSYNVVAVSADPSYMGQASATLTIRKAEQSISFAPLGNKTFGDTPFSLGASASSNLPVAFEVISGPASLNGNMLTLTGAGTVVVKASQAGDNNFNAATSVERSFNVAKAQATLSLSNLNQTYDGNPKLVTVTSNPANLETITITYRQNGNPVNSPLNAGSYEVTASLVSDSYEATPVSGTLVVAKATQTIDFQPLQNRVFREPDFTVSATTTSHLDVYFTGSGFCSVVNARVHLSGAGTCNITAHQDGNENFETATTVTQSFSVAQANPQIVLGSLTHTYDGTAKSASGTTTPAGLQILFTYNGSSNTPVNAGTYAVEARVVLPNYSGTATGQLVINKTSQMITFGAPGNKTFGDAAFDLSASASSALSVSFEVVSGPATLNGNTLTVTGVGSVKIRASQSGNQNYEAATPVEQTFAVAQAPTNVAVTSTANPSQSGQSVTFTAKVTATAGTPTGSVQFKDNGVNLGGPITLNASGVATLTTSSLTVGTHPVSATYSGDTNFTSGTGTLASGQVVAEQPVSISFASASYNVNEADGFVRVTVTRSGPTASAAGVDYATDDTGSSADCSTTNGLASIRCDVIALYGTLNFAANETQKSLDIPITLDSYNEGPEVFRVNLSNPNGAILITPSTTSVTINDSIAPAPNAIDDTTNFVRQQYHDFLNREPDPSGLAFWKNNIDKCNDPAQRQPGQTLVQCIDVQRTITSAAFFLSIESRETGGLVRDFYVAALNRPATNNMPELVEFQRDSQKIQRGVVVNEGNWEETLAANRVAFINEFVMRAEFVGLYPTTDSPSQYVDKLYLHAGLSPTAQERAAVIAEFGPAQTALDTAARGRALLRITKSDAFQSREINRAFVHMQYLGYLRRNPNAAPDTDYAGYDFWLHKLNDFGGDFLQAEMVKAFLASGEYRHRFGN